MGVRLPSAYQEVEYIQGRITYNPAYIDTLYIPTVNTKLRVKFSPDNQNQYGFFGAREDPYRFYCATFSTGSQLSCGMTVDTWPSSRIAMVFGRIYDCTIANGLSEIDGNTISTPVISAENWSESVGTIQLRSLLAGQYDQDSTAKYYLCQIWENDVLVRDFVPCYRKSDNEPGMYDLVSKTFYTNQGTGEFLVGPDVVNHISPRLMDRRRALIAKLTSLFKRVITSQTGLVSFDTNVAKPMKVACEFSPVQDLHGYDYPWPGGGSVNLISDGHDASNGYLSGGYLNADGTTSAGSGWYVSEYFPVSAGATYMWSTNQTAVGAASTCFYDENKQYISGESANGELPKAIVAPENAAYCRSSQLTTGKLCQIEKGAVAHSIVPYSNICPIEGFTEANPTRTGKNLTEIFSDPLNPNKSTYHTGGGATPFQYSAEEKAFYNTNHYGIRFYNNTSEDITVTASFSAKIRTTDANIYAILGGWNNSFPAMLSYYTNTWVRYSRSGVVKKNSSVNWVIYGGLYVKDFQIELGTTATEYEPYSGTTIPIVFNDPTTGNSVTVYGGTVTLNEDDSVDLTEKWVKIKMSDIMAVAIGTSAWNTGMFYTTLYYQTKKIAPGSINIRSDAYATTDAYMPNMADYTIHNDGEGRIYWRDTRYSGNVAALLAAMGNTEIAYEIRAQDQETYHFDNIEQLQSFLGTNNVWHNMNGPITVEYYKKQQ